MSGTTLARAPGFIVLAASAVASSALTGTNSETVLRTVAIPANAMGPNGILRVRMLWTHTSSGNAKTLRVRLGGLAGTSFAPISITANATSQNIVEIANRNATNSQIGAGSGTRAGDAVMATVTPFTTGAVDTTAAFDLVMTGELANTSESIVLERYTVELLKA